MSLFLLGLISNHTLGGQQHPRNGSGIFQRDPGHLRRIDNPGLQQILILIGAGIVTEIGLAFLHLLYDDAAFNTAVDHDLPDGFFQRPLDDRDTRRLILIGAFQLLQGFDSADISDPAARNDTLFYRSAG
jgi:hypothetical protein